MSMRTIKLVAMLTFVVLVLVGLAAVVEMAPPSPTCNVSLGTGIKDVDGFRRAFKNGGMHVSDWADDILGKSEFTVATHEIELDLIEVSVATLGFKYEASLKDIYEAAEKRGFELCPAEVGPRLRLQCKHQPSGEGLVIGMKPITASDGDPNIFCVDNDGGDLWLLAGNGDPDYVWNSRCRFIFVLPRK